jgi:hypothetical protein
MTILIIQFLYQNAFRQARTKITEIKQVMFEVLTATSMKMAVFWDVAPCILVHTDRRFSVMILMMEAVSSSETSVSTKSLAW